MLLVCEVTLAAQPHTCAPLWSSQAFELGNISVSYGPPSNPAAFAAIVLGAGDSWLLISSSEGFGVVLSITVTVSGQSAVSTSTGLAYGVSTRPRVSFLCALHRVAPPSSRVKKVPIVTAVSGIQPLIDFPGAMPTTGGTGIVLSGKNFGPAALFGVDVTSAVIFTYGFSLADPTSLVYTASGCAKAPGSPHTTISCYSVGGVGAGLVASISVSGVPGTVVSSNLTSLAYAPPTVTRISGSGAINANTAGGGVITVEGTGFGPSALNGVVSLAVGSPGWQRGPGALQYGRYAASGCTVLSSTLLTCQSVQGTGAGYAWVLTIAGQTVRRRTAFSGAFFRF